MGNLIREGRGRIIHMSAFVRKWEWSGRARDDYVSVISDRKCSNCPQDQSILYTTGTYHLSLIKLCAVCVNAGCGFTIEVQ